jgi:hypothetical protein
MVGVGSIWGVFDPAIQEEKDFAPYALIAPGKGTCRR